jgi:hypothetical protein
MSKSVALAVLNDWESRFPVDHYPIGIKRTAVEALDMDEDVFPMPEPL